MAMSRQSRLVIAGLAAATLAASVGDAFAGGRNRYSHQPVHGYVGDYRYHHRGIGPGPAIAGAALGIAGLAAGAVAADSYYNGYPAYGYGPRHGGYYGYDYVPNYGYYGPY